MCRKRGRIVLVGVTGLELSRADFYEKELTFQVSCSYGPGRYDPDYEEKGHDYPIGFVRWTEQRNFEAVLDMLADRAARRGAAHLASLPDSRTPRRPTSSSPATSRRSAILLEYPSGRGRQPGARASATVAAPARQAVRAGGAGRSGFIGAGNYAHRCLLPAFRKPARGCVASRRANGVSGTARRDASSASSSPRPTCGACLRRSTRSTRSSSPRATTRMPRYVVRRAEGRQARLRREAARASRSTSSPRSRRRYGRAVRRQAAPLLMVGFNRRFRAARRQDASRCSLRCREPKSFVMTVNAGAVPPEHWTQDAGSGGGRIVGEACHFIDLLRFLAGRADRRAPGLGGDDARLLREHLAALRRRLDRHGPLLRQRPSVLSQGAARGLLRRARPAARQLPQAARLRLAGLQHDEICGGRTRGRRPASRLSSPPYGRAGPPRFPFRSCSKSRA